MAKVIKIYIFKYKDYQCWAENCLKSAWNGSFLKGSVHRDFKRCLERAQTIRTDKIYSRFALFLFHCKETPSRENHKTGFNVLTTIELNLSVKLTRSRKRQTGRHWKYFDAHDGARRNLIKKPFQEKDIRRIVWAYSRLLLHFARHSL